MSEPEGVKEAVELLRQLKKDGAQLAVTREQRREIIRLTGKDPVKFGFVEVEAPPDAILVCAPWRWKEGEEPPVGVSKGTCSACGKGITVSDTSPQGIQRMCATCAGQHHELEKADVTGRVC